MKLNSVLVENMSFPPLTTEIFQYGILKQGNSGSASKNTHKKSVKSAIPPMAKTLLSLSRRDGIARVWRLPSGDSVVLAPPAPHGKVGMAAFSPDGKLIYTNSIVRPSARSDKADKTKYADYKRFRTNLWETATLEKLPMEILGNSPVISAQVSPDSKLFATSHGNGTTVIRDISGKRAAMVLAGKCHTGRVVALQFSRSGRAIVTSSTGAVGAINKTVAIWDTATGEIIKCFPKTPITAYALRLSENGKVLVIANNRYIRIVNTRNWSVVRRLHYPKRVNKAWYHSLSISPDGSLIAMGNGGPSVSIWNARNGQRVKVLHGHRRGVRVTQFDHESRRLITSSRDATARIWTVSLSSEKLVSRAKERVPRCLTKDERNTHGLSVKIPDWCFAMKKWPYHRGRKSLTDNRQAGNGNWLSNLLSDLRGLKKALLEKYGNVNRNNAAGIRSINP